jgi:hypothetical protein
MRLFILGVGAQKAGTSWLASYLSAKRNVNRGVLKEYHVWDALYVKECKNFLVPPDAGPLHHSLQLRRSMQTNPDTYFEYFARLLSAPGKDVAFDISPPYASLGREIFRKIIEGFASRVIECKAVFLMRDPVERCWSAVRMRHRLHASEVPVSPDAVLAYALSAECEIRTRYDKTLEELRASFEADRLHVGCYEDMFGADSIGRISAFCGVKTDPTFSEKRFNATEKRSDIGDDAKRQIADHYRDVYSRIGSMFPQARKLWDGYRFL